MLFRTNYTGATKSTYVRSGCNKQFSSATKGSATKETNNDQCQL